MADVGILNLQIHSESSQAEQSLTGLANALNAVKQAVSGIGLKNVATALQKINQAVNASTVENMNGLASALERVKAACDFTVPNLSGLNRVRKTMDEAASGASGVKKEIEEVSGDFETFSSQVDSATDGFKQMQEFAKGTAEIMQNMGTGAGGSNAFAQAFSEWSRMQSTRLLGSGMPEKEAWKENAIPVEGTVSDAISDNYGLIIPENHDLITTSAANGLATVSDASEQVKEATEPATAALQDMDKELKQKKDDAGEASTAINDFGNQVKNSTPHLRKFANELWRMIKRMAMRAAIKSVAEGIKEGIENLYWYSKAVGTDFAPAMDSAATSLLQMKNSIGAALAPAIEMLIPLLQTVVEHFINLLNYVNQFLALLNGQKTWTQAVPYATEAFTQTTKSAKESSKALKELLADWDELNIIQSETTSGGSGSNGKQTPDYASMFTENSEFDSSVKDIIRFIEEHMGGIGQLVKDIALAILGWRLSQAFEGVLGTLGQMLMGAMIMKIGIELSYGGAFDAGKKGYFDGSDLLKTLGGIVATGIGGYYIGHAVGGAFGGTAGAVIGVTVGVVAALKGWIDGQEIARDARKWGNLTWTQDEIHDFISSQFTFEDEAVVEIVQGHIENEREARKAVGAAIDKFMNSLETAKVNIGLQVDKDVKSSSVQQAAEDAQEAIRSINSLIQQSHTGIEFMMNTFKVTDDKGNDISASLMQSLTIADKTLQEYFTDMGKEIANYIYQGQQTGWKNGEMENALALMESEKRILAKAAELKGDMGLMAETRAGLAQAYKNGVFDQDTAKAVMEQQSQRLKEVEETLKEQKMELYADYIELAAIAQAAAEEAGLNTEEGQKLKKSADTYTDMATNILTKIDDEVSEQMDATRKKMAEEWAKTLRIVYGEDVDKRVIDKAVQNGTNIFGGTSIFGQEIKSMFLENLQQAQRDGDIAGYLQDFIRYQIQEFDTTGVVMKTVHELGLNMWTLLGEEAKQALFNNTAIGLNEDEAVQSIMAAFGLSEDEIKPYVQAYHENLLAQAQQAVQNGPQVPVQNAVTFENTADGDQVIHDKIQDMLADGVEDNEFVATIQDLTLQFGKDAVENALQDFDIPLDLINEALNTPIPGPTVDLSGLNDGINQIEQAVEDMCNNVRASIGGLNGIGFSFDANFGSGSMTGNLKVHIPVPKVKMAAGGGFLKSGDLIMANENGNIEMMGKMGSQPVVANNEQIVSGISQGVSMANSGVESRLTAIEQMMTRLLQKEFVARAVPGSEWGAHNAQSGKAYDKIRG